MGYLIPVGEEPSPERGKHPRSASPFAGQHGLLITDY